MPDPANFIIHDHKLAFMLIPKTGSSSIKHMLTKFLGYMDVHSAPIGFFPLPPDYLIITFVRNPLTRFLSGYNNKICDRFFQTLNRDHGMRPNMPLLEFAEIVRDTPDESLNQHFRSQAAHCLVDGRWLPNIVMRQESMQQGWRVVQAAVQQWCGLSLPKIGRLNPSVTTTKMTAKVEQIVRQRFRRDFELFGYE